MFTINTNVMRKRAKEEKRELNQGVTDNQELVVSLAEENAALKEAATKREQEITDLQLQIVSITEGGAK
jgi:hypothetical protein